MAAVTPQICAFGDCGRPKRSRGLCEAHYYQQRRGQRLRPHTADRRCEFAECEEQHSAKGLCVRHYRQSLTGRPLTALPAPRRNFRPTRHLDAAGRLAERSEVRPAPYGLPTPCTVWTGPATARGYGRIYHAGREWPAHVLAFYLHHGYRPTMVRHRCDNRPCIELSHLLPGDALTNARDASDRGRWSSRRGEHNTQAKLTWPDVRAIRTDTRPGRVLAAEFGVSTATISLIRRGRTWKVV